MPFLCKISFYIIDHQVFHICTVLQALIEPFLNLYIMKLDWLDCLCNDIIILFIYRNEQRETTL